VRRGQSTRLVVSRELREAVRRRSLWIVIAIVLAASTAAVVLPEVLSSGRTHYDVVIVDGSSGLERQVRAVATSLDVDVDLTRAGTVSEATRQIADGKADVALVAGDDPTVLAKEGRADGFVATVQQVLGVQSLAGRLEESGLSEDEIGRALDASSARVVRLDADDGSRQASAAIVSTVLYLLLLMLMSQVANGTAIEKANRISEVLLAIVRPGALLFGKVIGVGIVGVGTLLCAVLPVIVKLALGGDLPVGLGAAIVGGAAWFALGIVLTLTTAGALGALVERQEEAGSVVTPLTILLVGSFFVAQSASATPLGQVLAILPFTSTMVMPARIATGAASGPEMALSLALGLVAVLVVLRVGSNIYARAIVRTGRRLKLSEVLRSS